jgi:predicted choloylglycine hydrolase
VARDGPVRPLAGVRQQHKTFQAIEVGDGGDGRWAAYARGMWQEMEGLLTEEGRTPEGADRVRALFRAHMPELVPVLDRLAGQLDRPEAEAFLTHAALRPFSQACTQIGQNGTLLRNYDLRPDQCEGTIVSSCFLRPVIGMQDMLWGLLDGMNDAGLAVSLTWGGRSAYGRGFAILILVRYLLETCDTVDEAVDRLRSLPVAVPQNLTLVDPK